MKQYAIEVDHVSMLFHLNRERVDNAKEYVIRFLTRKLSFTKFRSYGGVIVSASYERGRVTSLELYSKDSVKIKIKNRFGVEEFGFSNGARIFAKKNEIFDIEFKGKIKLLTC